ncbi:unnamed protein product [Hymenolepis diminuta]|uniref:EF-hand domain-containing protein n=1 Tax=Hymenolepis diminuta TaxID=6216 RepID=A0A0R3SDX8_HYMDI|nr:unnamed protein product [Hymenolepis diminuta]VUZ49138.1 unnamed protein product [Hymenolepis diminuta]
MSNSALIKDFLDSVDKDGSGTIDSKELMDALEGSGLDESCFKRFIAEHDKDGDGKLNVKELTAFLESCGF